jgi:hypothetical protein
MTAQEAKHIFENSRLVCKIGGEEWTTDAYVHILGILQEAADREIVSLFSMPEKKLIQCEPKDGGGILVTYVGKHYPPDFSVGLTIGEILSCQMKYHSRDILQQVFEALASAEIFMAYERGRMCTIEKTGGDEPWLRGECCSECLHTQVDFDGYKFCPGCGARIQREEGAQDEI